MTSARAGASRARITLAAGALLLAGLDLAAKAVAERSLDGGRVVDLGLLQLRLAYNSGVAFSLGADLPGWTVPPCGSGSGC